MYTKNAADEKRNAREMFGMIIEGIKMECGVNAVLVDADVCCVVPKR